MAVVIERQLQGRTLLRCLRRVAGLTVLGLATTVLAANVPMAQRFTVTADQVTAAMRDQAILIRDLQVVVPASMTASVPAPVLVIGSMRVLGPGKGQVLVVCHTHTQCLPFYVTAWWPEQATIPASILPPAASQAKKRVPAQDASYPRDAETAAAVAAAPPRMRAGSKATLLIEGERVHIRFPVIALEGGYVGDRVRVSTPDHKETYLAEIVNDALLKGTI